MRLLRSLGWLFRLILRPHVWTVIFSKRIHVVPVIPMPDEDIDSHTVSDAIETEDKVRLSTIEQLRKLAPAGANLPFDLDFRVGFYFVPEGIVETAAKINADPIVMGVNSIGKAHYWSTAHHVVREAVCPVLTIRG